MAETGIYRKRDAEDSLDSAWVSDGAAGALVTEDVYQEKGYLPAFDAPPLRIVRRVPLIAFYDEFSGERLYVVQKSSELNNDASRLRIRFAKRLPAKISNSDVPCKRCRSGAIKQTARA